jgi:hypothetical protein
VMVEATAALAVVVPLGAASADDVVEVANATAPTLNARTLKHASTRRTTTTLVEDGKRHSLTGRCRSVTE